MVSLHPHNCTPCLSLHCYNCTPMVSPCIPITAPLWSPCTPIAAPAPVLTAPALMLPCFPVAAPVRFLRELQAQEVDEGATAHLHCELSQEGASVEWRKDSLQLFPCAKYQMVQEGRAAELWVHRTEQEDAGHYTCDTGHAQSTASLSVRGELPSGSCPPWGLTPTLGAVGTVLISPKHPSLAPQPLGPHSRWSCRAWSRRPAVWPGYAAS